MRKALVTMTIALLCAVWIIAISLLSIQNVFIVDATGDSSLVSLKFLGQSSIRMSLGLTLSLSAAVGMLGAGLLIPAFSRESKISHRRRQQR